MSKTETLEGMKAELYRLADARYVAAVRAANVQLSRTLAKAGVDVSALTKVEDLGEQGIRLEFGGPEIRASAPSPAPTPPQPAAPKATKKKTRRPSK